MKQFILLIITSIFYLTSVAQISVTESDMPDAPLFGQGDTIRYSTAAVTTLGINVSQTGANQNWDFSFLQPNGQGVNEYKNSASTLYSFLGAGFNAIGLKQPNVNLQVVQLTDAYEFYNKTTSVFEAKATGYSLSGIPLGSTYSNTDKIYQFPLNYNDNDTDDFHYTLSISNVPGISISVTYIRAGQRVNEVDGYGSITTPFGTYNCIRVKSTITETDTIDLGFGFPFAVPNNRIEYKWMANGIKIPVLQVDGSDLLGTFTITSIKYRDSYRNLAPNAEFVADNTTPLRWIPVNFTNQTSSASNANISYRWTITPDSMFTYINNTSRNSANPVVSFNVDTVFNVQLKATNSSGVDSIIKNQYIKVGSEIASVNTLNDLNKNVFVFPNPTTSTLLLNEFSNQEDIESLEFISVDGRNLQASYNTVNVGGKNSKLISTSSLASGIYTLIVRTNERVYNAKFVKQ